MATFGTLKLKECNPATDSIKPYLERVKLYFQANDVQEDRMVPILLSSIGSATYSLLSDLVAPETPSTKSHDDITKALENHFQPKRLTISAKFNFHKRDQAMHESITKYHAALRKLATHCAFEGHLDQALRDRFVCGSAMSECSVDF